MKFPNSTPRICRSRCFTIIVPSPGMFLALSLLLFVPACVPLRHDPLTAAASFYHPVRIAKGVPAGPGALAWSPDSKRLAFISKTVTIVDTDSLEQKQTDIPRASSLAWSENNTLYALSREADKTALFAVDPDRLSATRLPLDRQADMLYSLDADSLILVSARISATRIGSEISRQISRYAVATGRAKTLSTFSKIYPWKDPDGELLLAWRHAGVNPLDGSFLVMEHLKPPVVPAYSRVTRIDTLTGTAVDIPGSGRETLYASAGWSPDGTRVALADGNGRLELQTLRNDDATPVAAPAGLYPSWNPRGSIIYLGGSLVRTDGSGGEPLLSHSPRSIGSWSPDGTRLAVATDGRLLLFRNFTPSFSGADRPLDRVLASKLARLQNLLAEELISRQEYDDRRAGLLRETEEHP
ncbi:MAG: hypothetical protein OEW15_12335 [Nitrospirota bacterium]|nr:hypothetical protein [Nitrospirota bacterium]